MHMAETSLTGFWYYNELNRPVWRNPRTVAYREPIEWQLEAHAITAWDWLDTNAADAATSTAITTVSAKYFMLCLALGQTQIRGP